MIRWSYTTKSSRSKISRTPDCGVRNSQNTKMVANYPRYVGSRYARSIEYQKEPNWRLILASKDMQTTVCEK